MLGKPPKSLSLVAVVPAGLAVPGEEGQWNPPGAGARAFPGGGCRDAARGHSRAGDGAAARPAGTGSRSPGGAGSQPASGGAGGISLLLCPHGLSEAGLVRGAVSGVGAPPGCCFTNKITAFWIVQVASDKTGDPGKSQ